jgi:hypothetical protein
LALLKYVVEPLAKKYEYAPLIESGDYGQPHEIKVKWWAIQLASWCFVSVLARVVCGAFVVGLHDALLPVVAGMTRGFKGHGVLYLVVAMVGTPTFFNTIQVIVQDSILKKSESDAERQNRAHQLLDDGMTDNEELKTVCHEDDDRNYVGVISPKYRPSSSPIFENRSSV